MSAEIKILPYRAVADEAADASMNAIFFAASGTQSFTSVSDRQAFRQRWLGRFLEGDEGAHAFVAVADATVIGYLVGALDDPARSGRFADVDYFRDFAHLTPTYPAHLHINMAPAARSRGIGARLIDAFADHARAAGAPGMHVVTGAASRNVQFYRACGFVEVGRLETSKPIVFLGREL